VIGIAAGAVLGYLAALLIAHERWAFLTEYAPVVTLVAVIGAYFAADGMQASGFMAVFVFGIVLGNKEAFGFKMAAGEAQKLDEHVLTTAFIMRLFIFILLGAQVDFAPMRRYWAGGVIVVAVLMLVARPATVFLCAGPDRRARWSFNEMLFMCWTRETGVIPAALAGLLLGMKAPGAQMIASVTFIAILMTILIQAPTTEWLGRKLDCWSNAGRVDRGNRISVIPGRALRANPESRDRIPLLDSGSAPKRRIPERRISSPRPRRAAKRLRGLAEGADEGAAHPLRIAEAGRLRHLLDRLA
jgi:NhaP-type Na+/H+ or K+/H+ antiporter